MKNELLDKGIILPSGEIGKDKLERQRPAGLHGERRIFPHCPYAAGHRVLPGGQDSPAAGGDARIFPLLGGQPAAGLRRGAYHEPAGAAFRPPGAGRP